MLTIVLNHLSLIDNFWDPLKNKWNITKQRKFSTFSNNVFHYVKQTFIFFLSNIWIVVCKVLSMYTS